MASKKTKTIKIDLTNGHTDLYYDLEKDVDLDKETVKFILKEVDDDKSIEAKVDIINAAARKVKVTFLGLEFTKDDVGIYEGIFEIGTDLLPFEYPIELYFE
ncbi:hypothetical protein AB1283_25965 [Bacillus sp. S13(2024)]|uniref:hypothetical protein n=1 Tax=Bacillus sp. S13(2024) TaxID=3162885 RepID=UPI003D246058